LQWDKCAFRDDEQQQQQQQQQQQRQQRKHERTQRFFHAQMINLNTFWGLYYTTFYGRK
jgi:hypothetical protein